MESGAPPRDTAWAMSEENLEIVRSSYEAFDRGDIDAVLANADPALVTYRADPEAAIWHGPDGFLQAMADWTEGFDQFNARAEEFRDAGDRVIVRVHQRALGQSSGAPVEADFWFVHSLSRGKVTRVDIFASKGPALAAAGLSE
jgi:ketosteroid isomerase-like protein